MNLTVVLVNVVGWVGMALLIGAYALVTMSRIHPTGTLFQAMNLFGGGFLMVNSAWYSAWPSAALNLVWVTIGSVGADPGPVAQINRGDVTWRDVTGGIRTPTS